MAVNNTQIWAIIGLAAAALIGLAVYLGVDLAAVGRALLWLKEFAQ